MFRRENDGRHHHRSGQWSTARFIHAGFQVRAALHCLPGAAVDMSKNHIARGHRSVNPQYAVQLIKTMLQILSQPGLLKPAGDLVSDPLTGHLMLQKFGYE